ncbi:MAG: DUF7255 family protein [Pelotomaculum sp.]|jgi:hypothetical protein
MPRQKQVKIVNMVAEILQCEPRKGDFHWLNNLPQKKYFGSYYDTIFKIYMALGGNKDVLDDLITRTKPRKLSPDAFFPEPFNFIFEFDEIQHFTEYKSRALRLYPKKIQYGFELEKYIQYCYAYADIAIKKGPSGYRKPTKEFIFDNGRAAQRAFFDSFRDIQPTLYGLRPTVRISELELPDNFQITDVKKILKERLRLISIKNLVPR